MIDVFGVLYCVCIVIAVVALAVSVVVDVVEHFQFKRQIKIIERLEEEELEESKKNENRA